MRVGPLLKHFGSKWSATKRGSYPEPLPGLPIFEPYAGSAGYSLNFCDHEVVLWEDDWMLETLWRWLINEATTKLIMQIPLGLCQGLDIRAAEPDLCFGQQLLLKHWQRTNNVGGCWTISKWGHMPGQWTSNTRERLAREVLEIKHWKIGCINYRSPGTYYFDPPYEFNYQYRFKTPFNYDRMVYNISLIPKGSRVIVCEAAHPKTGEKPHYLPFIESHSQVTSRRKVSEHHHSKELIWTTDT